MNRRSVRSEAWTDWNSVLQRQAAGVACQTAPSPAAYCRARRNASPARTRLGCTDLGRTEQDRSCLRRIFLGWDKPILHAAVHELFERYATADCWNLGGVMAVVPVSRAARRLLALLERHAEEHDLPLIPPRVVTVGGLPERLYENDRPIASELQQTLAWTRVLSATPDPELEPLMPVIPEREPIAPWVEMASTLRRLHEDLSAEALGPLDVIEHVETDGERNRWRLIDRLHQRFLGLLDQAGLSDPHAARREALEQGRCRTAQQIVIIACVDFGRRICQLIEAVDESVDIFLGAPESEAAGFDSCGRVEPEFWANRHIDVVDRHLIAAGDADQQCAAAASVLADWGDRFSPDQITIGITDDAFAPLVETELTLCGLRPHRVAGIPLTRTAPGRLLRLISDYLTSTSWQSFAALVRHADVLPIVAGTARSSDLLTELDTLRATHFPVRLSHPLPAAASDSDAYASVHAAASRVSEWLAPFVAPRQPLALWCQRTREVLSELYDRRRPALAADSASSADAELVDSALQQIDEILEHFADLAAHLDIEVTAPAALDMLLQRLADPRPLIAPLPDRIEIAGWLDLALDDAAALVVIGLNTPFVPQAVTSDPFLPGTLRSKLRVADNERRFARDAYVLQVVLSTRPAKALIVGRNGPDGSPTPPSRLLAASPPEVVVRRVRKLLEHPPKQPKIRTDWHRDAGSTELPIPTAVPGTTLEAISVTAFRDYMACPFRFYLRHIVGLRPLDDAAFELAANQFGDLVHAAVEGFGDCGDREASDVDVIADSLMAHLHEYAARQFGNAPSAAVRLQIAQAEKRLRVVAERQAERRAAGWQIYAAEASVVASDGACIALEDGRRLALKGRVDRIDFHPATGRWAILDYKTHGHQPMAKHYDRRAEIWLDLQLPLYLQMLSALKIDAAEGDVDVGYFNIAEKADETGIHLAEFTPELLASAMIRAREVARGVLDAAFDVDPEAGQVLFDDYAAILQTGAAQNLLADDLTTSDSEAASKSLLSDS